MTATTARPGIIELTSEEQDLFQRLDLTQSRGIPAIEALQSSESLFWSLQEREAIPKTRWAYFAEADHHISGHGTSRLGWFRRNGRTDAEIPRHSNFIKYLRYFICGPNLPKSTIEGFCRFLDENQPHSSGDVEPLKQYARTETRTHDLVPHHAAEEFYKLAIECDLSAWTARAIRDAVKKIKR